MARIANSHQRGKSNFNTILILGFKTFIIVFVIFILVLKFFGYPDRYDLVPNEPMSWSEIYETMPLNLTVVVALTMFLIILHIIVEYDKKKAEEANKRKKEQERQEQEQMNKNK